MSRDLLTFYSRNQISLQESEVSPYPYLLFFLFYPNLLNHYFPQRHPVPTVDFWVWK